MVRALAVIVLLGCEPVGDDAADAAPLDSDPSTESDAAARVDAAQRPDGTHAPRPGYRFPIHAGDRATIRRAPIFHVDHGPPGGQRLVCTNYAGAGFPSCYGGHDGTDFLLDGGFFAMDNGSARVVAAEAGEVVSTADGNYDRCHGSPDTGDVDCDGHPMRANHVVLRHANGRETRYWHLKSGSVAVDVGDVVECGEALGLVGSSGRSTVPHLHFEVHERGGASIDPFAGPESRPESLWREQEAGDGLPSDACE